MRILSLCSALLLAVIAYSWTGPGDGGLVATATAAAGADPAVVAKACLKCHEGEYSLSMTAVSQLTEQIKAIRDGTVEHPPGIKGMTDVQIEAVAAYLGKQ